MPYDGKRGYFILGFAYGGGSMASMEVAEGMLDPLFETDATVEALDEAHAQAKEYVGAEAKGHSVRGSTATGTGRFLRHRHSEPSHAPVG